MADRRTFLAAVTTLTGATLLEPLSRSADALAQEAVLHDGPWDLSWVKTLRGRHRQVFDTGTVEDALRIVANYLDAFETILGMKFPDVNVIVGIAGRAFPINASDALWQKYQLGKGWNVTDPETKAPALRNIFETGGATPQEQKYRVRALQARGAIFWQCNNALHTVAERLAPDAAVPPETVYQDLRAGLLPGVRLIPAHTMLLSLVQEQGCAYQRL